MNELNNEVKLHHGVPTGKTLDMGTIWHRGTCPYNESHSVGRGSYVLHIEKCRGVLPPVARDLYIVCPYNESHQHLRTVHEDHLLKCPEYRYHLAQQFPYQPVMFGRPPLEDWETPGARRIRMQQEKREEQILAGTLEADLTKVDDGKEDYTEEDFEAFLAE